MHHDELAVLGFHNVELDPVGTCLGSRLQGGKGVLHATLDESAVRENLRFVAVDELDHGVVVQHHRDCERHKDGARGHAPQQLLTASGDR